MCMLTLGTGVGAGLILNARVWHGYNGMAGEMGHTCVQSEGLECSCGGRGCLERYASATEIAEAGRRWFRENKSELISAAEADTLTAHSIANLASKGHEGMRAVYEAVGFYPGISIAQTVTTLDLPLYVIGAGVLSAWDLRRLSFEP